MIFPVSLKLISRVLDLGLHNMADTFSGPSFLYHLLANELSVVLFNELDKVSVSSMLSYVL